MTIRREVLEAGLVDLGDVTDGSRLAPVHPGSVLRHEYLEPLGMSVYGLAAALACRVPASTKSSGAPGGDGRNGVASWTVLRHERGFLAGLQAAYDLEVARDALGEKIKDEVHPRAA